MRRCTSELLPPMESLRWPLGATMPSRSMETRRRVMLSGFLTAPPVSLCLRVITVVSRLVWYAPTSLRSCANSCDFLKRAKLSKCNIL
jgi:hypothetical protein